MKINDKHKTVEHGRKKTAISGNYRQRFVQVFGVIPVTLEILGGTINTCLVVSFSFYHHHHFYHIVEIP